MGEFDKIRFATFYFSSFQQTKPRKLQLHSCLEKQIKEYCKCLISFLLLSVIFFRIHNLKETETLDFLVNISQLLDFPIQSYTQKQQNTKVIRGLSKFNNLLYLMFMNLHFKEQYKILKYYLFILPEENILLAFYIMAFS